MFVFLQLKAEREEQYKPKPVITIIDEDDEKPSRHHHKEKEVQEMPPIETEPIDSDSDEAAHYDNGTQPQQEISRTPPRPHHHHHRRHHRHHQNHHRSEPPVEDLDEVQHIEPEPSKDKRNQSPPIIRSTTPPPPQNLPPPAHDEDSRMSLVSEPDKVSSSSSECSFTFCSLNLSLLYRLNKWLIVVSFFLLR